MPAIVIIITAFMLFLGAAPLPYYPYYPILRIVVTIVFIWAALVANSRERSNLLWLFCIGAILFNPILPIELPKPIWFVIDIACGVFLLFNLKILKGLNNDELETKEINGDQGFAHEFIGDTKNGKPNGNGIFTSPNGNKYEGGFRNGKYDGQGTLTWPNGNKYEGEWKDGDIHGHGIFTTSDGDKYVGEFKENIYWNGTEYDKNGNLKVKYVNGEKKE